MSNRIKGNLPCGSCGSSDAVSAYRDDMGVVDATCHACSTFFDAHATQEAYGDLSDIKSKPPMSKEDLQEALDRITAKKPVGIRDRLLKTETTSFYGVRVDPEDGLPVKHYYPLTTEDGTVVAYKVKNCAVKKAKNDVRKLKDQGEEVPPELAALAKSAAPFYTLGVSNRKSMLFGQHLFAKGQKNLIITEGEVDAMSVFQVLRNKERGYNTPVVSVTIGSDAAVDQVRAQFAYVSSFDKVYVCFDSDKAGQKAALSILRLLKPNQGYNMKLRQNDANAALLEDGSSSIKEAFFKAEPFSSCEIVESGNTLSLLIERASTVKLSLPPFMKTMQDMLNGGIALGEITVIAAPTSAGKTSLINELVYHWIMETQYKVGIASLEADLAETVENLMGIHLNRRLSNMSDDEKLEYYRSDDAARSHKTVTINEFGDDRFVLLNHLGGLKDTNDLLDKVELLIKGHKAQVIVVDPLQLGLSGKSLEETDEFMSGVLQLAKANKVAIVLVAHIRKTGGNEKSASEGAVTSEESIKGSGSIIQISFNTILLYRNKMAECETERNTLHTLISKARRTGNTGPSGSFLFNKVSGRLAATTTTVSQPLLRDKELFALVEGDASEKVKALLDKPIFAKTEIKEEKQDA